MTPSPISVQPRRSVPIHGSAGSPLLMGKLTLIRARNPPIKAPVKGENCPTCKTKLLFPIWKATMINTMMPIHAADLTTMRGDEFIHFLLSSLLTVGRRESVVLLAALLTLVEAIASLQGWL